MNGMAVFCSWRPNGGGRIAPPHIRLAQSGLVDKLFAPDQNPHQSLAVEVPRSIIIEQRRYRTGLCVMLCLEI